MYGGVEVLKLYLTYNTVFVVQKLEDSGVNITNTLTNTYLSERNQNISIGFRQKLGGV